jgi:hypothetical protein
MTVTVFEFSRLKEKLAIQYFRILYQHIADQGVVLAMRSRVVRTIALPR